MNEVWKVAPGHEEHLVSSSGRVRHRRVNAPLIKGHVDADGYRRVRLDGVQRRVHRLVCEAFHGPSPAGCEVAHIDGDPLNNCADNLAWKTPGENSADKLRHGTHQAGERHPRVKLSGADVADIRHRVLDLRHPQRAVARAHGINQSQVSRICSGERWAEGIAQPSTKAVP